MVQSKLKIRTQRRAIVELQNHYAPVTRFEFRRKTQTLAYDVRARRFFSYYRR